MFPLSPVLGLGFTRACWRSFGITSYLENEAGTLLFFKCSSQKQVYLVRLGPTTGTFYKQVKSTPYESCHWSKAHCTCYWPDKAQVHPSLSTLLDFQLFFAAFLGNQMPSIVPPYAPHTNADVRGDPSTLDTPHHAKRATRFCLGPFLTKKKITIRDLIETFGGTKCSRL